MGVEVKLDMNTQMLVEIPAAIDRGLLAGGKTLLALSDLGVPVEAGEPRHGVHGVETGFVRVESSAERVAIGYTAFWLLWQHERMDYKHPNGGHAKFLELAMVEGNEAALEVVAASLRELFSA